MKLPRIFAALVAAASLAGTAGAHDYKLGDLEIGHPYAIATPASAKSGAGYLSITNIGSQPDRLLAVKANFPMVVVHSTEVDAAGVARMTAVDGLEIAPGETVTLAPGGMHVMFMGLTAPWAAGDEIDATLVFEKAGQIEVQFQVQPRGEGAGGQMQNMDQGAMGGMHMGAGK